MNDMALSETKFRSWVLRSITTNYGMPVWNLVLPIKHSTIEPYYIIASIMGLYAFRRCLWPKKTGICHAIIVHPPAGIAGGDHLTFDMKVEAQCACVSYHARCRKMVQNQW